MVLSEDTALALMLNWTCAALDMQLNGRASIFLHVIIISFYRFLINKHRPEIVPHSKDSSVFGLKLLQLLFTVFQLRLQLLALVCELLHHLMERNHCFLLSFDFLFDALSESNT